MANADARAGAGSDDRQTSSGIPLQPVYEPMADGQAAPRERPGEFPFTRGIRPRMYRDRLWTMRQYAGFGSAQESNERYKFLLAQGQTGLSVAFDLPTQMGRDSDHPLARGEVGRTGVAISTMDDMRTLLDGLPLEGLSLSMTINATAATLLAFYVALADERGSARRALEGTIQNDILKEYIARGTYIYPPAGSMALIADVFRFCQCELPRFNTISISGYHIREAGSDAVQEVAFTLADGLAYIEAALRSGLRIDDFAPRLSFFFNAHTNFLEEIAKFRAARRLWARLVRTRYQPQDVRSCMLRFHAQTAGSSLVAVEPLTNVVRTTMEAMAAVLGGAQSLHTNSYDEALALPTEASAQLALRTQQVIAYESGLADVTDPLGGCYAIEALTDEIERRAEALIRRIDDLGGMVAAIEAGFPQREIEQRAYQHQKSIEDHRVLVVGVNACLSPAAAAPSLSLHRPAPHLEALQIERVRRYRAQRSQEASSGALASLETTARAALIPGTDRSNLVDSILAAVKARATLGEIADALRAAFGEYRG